MADEKLYKYVANKDPGSTVDTVILSEDGEKVAHLGEPIWLTDEEVANAGSIVLEDASYEEGAPPKSRRTDGDPDVSDDTVDEDPVVAAGEEAVDPDALQEHEVEYNTDGTPKVPEGQAGGVVDPNPGGGVTSGYAGSGPSLGDGQGSRGASGQDAATTTGGGS